MPFKKILIPIILVLALVGFIVFQLVSNGGESEFTLAKVQPGNVYQEVLETGSVKTSGKVNLGFKNAGTIEQIYVSVGDEVWPGRALVKLETNQLAIELREAEANLAIAQAKLDQLLAGASVEEIQAAETTVLNARQNLADVKADAQEDLNQAYEDALVTLDSAYIDAFNAFTTVNDIYRSYFEGKNDQEAITVQSEKNIIVESLSLAKTAIDEAKADEIQENIDAALSQLKSSLNDIYDSIAAIRDITDVGHYQDIISSADKTALDTEKANINSALTDVVDAQQNISSTKITNEKNINSAEGTLREAEDALALKKADPRQEDINLYQAQVNQAQAKVDLLRNKIEEATLKSSVYGKVTKINKEVGETALTESVVTILPSNPYEIETDIYEEDIVKIEIGNPVDIELIALPERIFRGRVVSIDPAEELIEGVVYYTVTINFDEEVPQGVKTGMTADIAIKTGSRENVLVVPEDAIEEKDGKEMVKVFKDGKTEEREITIGMEGDNDLVEILSGLSEGEEVILE